MEQPQDRISDERLAKLVEFSGICASQYPTVIDSDNYKALSELIQVRRELTALRASHAGLKHAVEHTLRCLEETGWDQEIHASVPGALRGALADARKLEGK